jgi:hypothetical protein
MPQMVEKHTKGVNVSKFADKLELLISEAEDKVRDRDETVFEAQWAQSWLKAQNQLEMLNSDRSRTSFPDDAYLPDSLGQDELDILDKMAKRAFPASKELTALMEQIATRFAILEDPEERDELDVPDELIQRAQELTNAYKRGIPASDSRLTRTRTSGGEPSESEKLRNLPGTFILTFTAQDGTKKVNKRTGNHNGLSWQTKTYVDKVDKAEWPGIRDDLAKWGLEILSGDFDPNRTFRLNTGELIEITYNV